MPKNALPEWERVLSAAAHLQQLLPDAVLVGGTASAIHVEHRQSHDADHVLSDLTTRFDDILAQLESVAGWKTAPVQRPVQMLGSLDGIETGVRQLIRKEPLETVVVNVKGQSITVPTKPEILRIKAALILKRNATRDYLDFIALADHLGLDAVVQALARFDALYPQPNGESALQQLQIQLANPMPYDLDSSRLNEYKNLDPKWHDWDTLRKTSASFATAIFEGVSLHEKKHLPGDQ